MSFATLPSNASLKPFPFKPKVSDEELQALQQLVKLCPIGPETYETRTTDVKDYNSFGVGRKWLVDAKERWQKHDWRVVEAKITKYPNYKVEIEDGGFKFDVHFLALFSKKSDAIPILFMHGWPGSFLEFLGTLNEFSTKYNENTLPYHIIVPSLPGYAYSNGPPLDRDFTVQDIAKVMDKLMTGLGFSSYISQGGDIGSFVTRVLGSTHEACKAAHIGLCIGPMPEGDEMQSYSEKEMMAMKQVGDFWEMGSAYARMHGTRPSTIGLVLASSPIALLTWVGEKFQQWTDESPSIDEILDTVTLWWLTQTFPRSIYPYRQFFGTKPTTFHGEADFKITKPLGYTWQPKEIAPVPVKLVAKTGNLVWHREMERGGHFAAMELPKDFVEAIEDFVKVAWPMAMGQQA